MEHESVLRYLDNLGQRTTPSGAVALKLRTALAAHMAFEEAVEMPPLVLLPELAKGIVRPDMRWAIEMSDKVLAAHDKIQGYHNAITAAALGLQDAAESEHDEVTVGFVRDVAADDLGDAEVTEPIILLIGTFLRSRLPPQ